VTVLVHQKASDKDRRDDRETSRYAIATGHQLPTSEDHDQGYTGVLSHVASSDRDVEAQQLHPGDASRE